MCQADCMAQLVQDCIRVHALLPNFGKLLPSSSTYICEAAFFVVQLDVHVVLVLARLRDEVNAGLLGVLFECFRNQGSLCGVEFWVDGVRDDTVQPFVAFISMPLRLRKQPNGLEFFVFLIVRRIFDLYFTYSHVAVSSDVDT